MKQDPRLCHLPVVVLSGLEDERIGKKCPVFVVLVLWLLLLGLMNPDLDPQGSARSWRTTHKEAGVTTRRVGPQTPLALVVFVWRLTLWSAF